jgi:hypothetical protein
MILKHRRGLLLLMPDAAPAAAAFLFPHQIF